MKLGLKQPAIQTSKKLILDFSFIHKKEFGFKNMLNGSKGKIQGVKNMNNFIDKINKIDSYDKMYPKNVKTKFNNAANLKSNLKNILGYSESVIHYKLSDKARIHGFIKSNVFHVLFIDMNHAIN